MPNTVTYSVLGKSLPTLEAALAYIAAERISARVFTHVPNAPGVMFPLCDVSRTGKIRMIKRALGSAF